VKPNYVVDHFEGHFGVNLNALGPDLLRRIKVAVTVDASYERQYFKVTNVNCDTFRRFCVSHAPV